MKGMDINMRILVDADACPVKDIIERKAKAMQIPVVMFIDTSHMLNSDYSEIIMVSKAPDAVDFALINRSNKGDIIVTQDYGVAAMALGKKSYAIGPKGHIYDNENMDRLLFERHISQKVRKGGGKTSNPKKRTKDDDDRLYRNLLKLILEG